MRIFMGLTEIAGNYAYLARGFLANGVEAEIANFFGDKFGYPAPRSRHASLRFASYFGQRRRLATGRAQRAFWVMMLLPLRLWILVWACTRFDVFIFGFGTSFFSYLELPLLKWLGKTIIVQFHGSDIRPPFIDGAMLPLFKSNKDQLKRIRELSHRRRVLERYADVVIAPVTCAQFLNRKIVDPVFLGKPVDVTESRFEVERRAPHEGDGMVRVMHAPSQLAAKGTLEIRQVIDDLVALGLPIDYVEISNATNAKVMDELSSADILIDQLYSDIVMPSLAKEAAVLGVPVIVSGYYSEVFDQEPFCRYTPPVVVCLPDALAETLETLVNDREKRLRAGMALRNFVRTEWTAERVAARYLQVIRQVAPQEWFVDPASFPYLKGCALSEEAAKKNVSRLIASAGVGSLQLDHKPRLRDRFVAWSLSPPPRDAGGNGVPPR